MTRPTTDELPLTLADLFARRADPTPVEIAFLAYALLSPALLEQCTKPRLRPAAATLHAILVDAGSAPRAIGLGAYARLVIWAYGSLFEYSADVADDALHLAERVDAVTLSELAGLAPFDTIASLVHARARRRRPSPRRLTGPIDSEIQGAALLHLPTPAALAPPTAA